MSLKSVFLFTVCACYVLARPADARKAERPKPHESRLENEAYLENGEHNPEFDKEAFLGDQKEEFDSLSPEEAKKRLKILFKKIDGDEDKFVTSDELKAWVKEVFKKKMNDGAENDIKEKDKNGDSFIDWEEFLKDSYGDEYSPDDEEMKKMVERDRTHFNVADANKDGKLTAAEFGTFLHPENSEEMKALNAKETLEGKHVNTR